MGRRIPRVAVVTAAVALSSLPALLRRMTAAFDSRGGLRLTTGWMYAEYLAHATIYAGGLKAGGWPSTRASRSVGGGLIVSGGLLVVSGVTRFSGPGQVSGTRDGELVSDGIYASTRNPQYLGYLGLLFGGAFTRRSAPGLLLTGTAAAVLDRRIPVEERHLRRIHGPTYDQYASGTARWLDEAGLSLGSRVEQRISGWAGPSA